MLRRREAIYATPPASAIRETYAAFAPVYVEVFFRKEEGQSYRVWGNTFHSR